MDIKKIAEDELVVGFDIGTRSIVGVVSYNDYQEKDQIKVLASHTEFHPERSMIDGQIQNIDMVARTINKVKTKIEDKIGKEIKSVNVAAAGRVLKTVFTHVEIEYEQTSIISEEVIQALELKGLDKAESELKVNSDEREKFFCVGYTVSKYYINDYEIASLKDQRGHKIGLDILATYLPLEVVESLYTVVEKAGMNVDFLTLEPIAASKIAIPSSFRLLNIALVDIGAGTSDIAITGEGSIYAYGMIPIAGDEITEKLVHEYFVDFETADQIKIDLSTNDEIKFNDIMGDEIRVKKEEVLKVLEPILKDLASRIGEKIKELNNGKPTTAVFVVGGGGQVEGFVDLLAKELGLGTNRVSLRGQEALKEIEIFDNDFHKSPEFITPIGICYASMDKQRHDFIEVFFNDESLKIFNKRNLKIIDILAAKGIDPKCFIAEKGEDLIFNYNGKRIRIRGEYGEIATIYKNKEKVSLNEPVRINDYISFIEAKEAQAGKTNILDFLLNQGYSEDELNENMDQIFLNHRNVKTLLQAINSGDKLVYRSRQVQEAEEFIEERDKATSNEGGKKKEIKHLQTPKTRTIRLIVNNSPLTMNHKNEYIFVDIFDFIDINLSRVNGTLVCRINGEKATYMQVLKDGDKIEAYWKEK